MDATAETTPPSTHPDYKSRPGALIWSFRESRDGWKRTYRELKAAEKASRNRIADLTRSREQWRTKAEQVGEQLAAVEVELTALRARATAATGGKNLGWQT